MPKQALDSRTFHEFWRLQLLDELHRKLDAFEWQPALDRSGRRRAALAELIERYERIEAAELRSIRGHGTVGSPHSNCGVATRES